MRKNSLRGIILLLITATIWGTAFVSQSVSMDHIGPFTFNAIRSFIGALVLLPFILYRNRKRVLENTVSSKEEHRMLLIGGLACGVLLFAGSNLQQIGICHSTVGKSAFITTLYIVLVPLLGLFLKKKVHLQIWLSVLLAMVGLYMLCMKDEGFILETGDIFLLLCALAFSLQIMAVDHFSPHVDGVKLSALEFLVTGVLSSIPMFLYEHPELADIRSAAFPILYAGAFSCGIAYTLQIVAQKNVNPMVASLIMSLESVIAALSGWIILHESMSPKELLGCGMVFGAVILTQIPMKPRE